MERSWTLLTHGHLPMNKFWGETTTRRSSLCTSTLIRTEDGFLVVDPPHAPGDMDKLLNDKAGLRPSDIRHVFLTHHHFDHRVGLEAFEPSQWWMSEEDLRYWKEHARPGEEALISRFRSPGAELLPGFRTRLAPGHTPGSMGIQFEWRGQRVLIAGDAIVTEEHFRAQRGYDNSLDDRQSHQTIRELTPEADLVVPGHGNLFFTQLEPGVGGMWSGGKR